MKSSTFALLALAIGGSAAPLAAQVRFSGTTFGCFGESCTPTFVSELNYLNFTGSNFDMVTAHDGTGPINLGSFTWDAFQGETLLDSPFTLFIGFTNPTGITPDPVYHTDIAGLVIRGKLNGVRVGSSTASVVFQPNVREFEFTGGDPDRAGRFQLTINDTYIQANNRSVIHGKITDATVTPEPLSMVLMGSGLAGIAAARRRRKQQQQQA